MSHIKETTIQKKRYRIVRCSHCEKVFNAFLNGKTTGILYSCIEDECRRLKNQKLEPVSKEEAAVYVRKEFSDMGWMTDRVESEIRKKFEEVQEEQQNG